MHRGENNKHRFYLDDMLSLAAFLADFTPTSQVQINRVLQDNFGVSFADFCHLANAVLFSCLPSSHLNADEEFTHVFPYRQFENGIQWLERTGGVTTASDHLNYVSPSQQFENGMERLKRTGGVTTALDVQPEDPSAPLPDSPGTES